MFTRLRVFWSWCALPRLPVWQSPPRAVARASPVTFARSYLPHTQFLTTHSAPPPTAVEDCVCRGAGVPRCRCGYGDVRVCGNMTPMGGRIWRCEKGSPPQPARDDGVPVDTMRRRGLKAEKSISHITDLVFHLLSRFYLHGYQRPSK